jgi:hypothetical protein
MLRVERGREGREQYAIKGYYGVYVRSVVERRVSGGLCPSKASWVAAMGIVVGG